MKALVYREGQTAGRGFIGLASMIFGNYRPLGIFMGSGLFGFADALQLRSDDAVHGLLVLISLILLIFAIKQLIEKKYTNASISIALSVAFLIWFLSSENVPSEFVYFTPHITTLIVLSSASQKLRMPQKLDNLIKKVREANLFHKKLFLVWHIHQMPDLYLHLRQGMR